MPQVDDLFMHRKSLNEICTVPDKIISVYSLERHVWADGNSDEARKSELQTIEEFQIDPGRPFLNDSCRNMAAPYSPARRDNPIGQGYWIQAEFGSGKSHLLCFLSALALGSKVDRKPINGIVKAGEIPKGAKPNQNISAAQNFGFGLRIIKKSAEKKLDISDNPYVQAVWNFIDEHLASEAGQEETI